MEDGTTLLTGGVQVAGAPNLAGLLARKGELEAEIRQLSNALANEYHDATYNMDGAAERAREIAAALEVRQAELATVRGEVDTLRAQQSAAQRAAGEAQRCHGLRELAVAARNHVEIAGRAQKAGEDLANALRELRANGVRIDSLSRGILPVHGMSSRTEAARLFSFSAMRERVQLAFFRVFDAPTEMQSYLNGLPPSFFPYDPPINGAAQFTKTLPERELDVLDAIPISVFETFDEAVEARNRRDPAGNRLHPVQGDAGLWTLQYATPRGVAARAETHKLPDRAA